MEVLINTTGVGLFLTHKVAIRIAELRGDKISTYKKINVNTDMVRIKGLKQPFRLANFISYIKCEDLEFDNNFLPLENKEYIQTVSNVCLYNTEGISNITTPFDTIPTYKLAYISNYSHPYSLRKYYGGVYNFNRSNPILIQVFKEMQGKFISGHEYKIVNTPEDWEDKWKVVPQYTNAFGNRREIVVRDISLLK